MRVFVTGITGFVGHHLADALVQQGHDVHGLARYVSNRGGLSTGPIPDVDYHIGDLLDPYTVRETIAKVDPDVVIHLATQSSVEYSFNQPYHSYNVGFLSTIHVGQAALKETSDLERFIYASSVEVYGNRDEFPLHEGMAPKPASPYGVAKSASEHYFKYLYRAHDFPVTVFRSANTYGRKRNSWFVIERIIDSMIQNQGRVMLGDPAPVRDFLFVEDEVRAFERVLEAGSEVNGETFNTGTTHGVSIRELANTVRDLLGYDGEVVWHSNSHRPLEIDKLIADYSKLEERVGWEPRYTLREGLKETIREWST
jgi:dTDP-glucose 4,6-dehydratase